MNEKFQKDISLYQLIEPP